MEAHSELAKLLTEKELRDALLLIFANKQVPESKLHHLKSELEQIDHQFVSFVCAGRPRRRFRGGDDGAAEPTQAVLWEELAHPGLRRPQRDGSARGAGLALSTAGGRRRPGRGLNVTAL